MAKHLIAYRHKLEEPVSWTLRPDQRAVFHRIERGETVSTPDGEMLLVSIAHKAELGHPDTDVAILVGQVIMHRKSGIKNPMAPELWFWNDAFWIKAKAGDGTPYYGRKKQYLIYQVQVANVQELMQQIKFSIV